MIGTSANLCHRDILSIYQLYHALMLPSGNDAATVLAENFVLTLFLGGIFVPGIERQLGLDPKIQTH
jgi:hypothetical protein